MRYLLLTYQWRFLTRPQVAAFDCPVTMIPTIKLNLYDFDMKSISNLYLTSKLIYVILCYQEVLMKIMGYIENKKLKNNF
jgi:hypothetical protein